MTEVLEIRPLKGLTNKLYGGVFMSGPSNTRFLTVGILIAIVLGALIGWALPGVAPYVSWLGQIFKLSLAMIVMPLGLQYSLGCNLPEMAMFRSMQCSNGCRVMVYINITLSSFCEREMLCHEMM